MSKQLETLLPFWAGPVLVALLALLPATVAPAAAKNWNAGDGNWNVPGNWSPASVPVGGEPVNIVHTDGTARTVTYDVNAPSIGLLSIDLTGAGAATDTLSIPSNNSLSANGLWVGGYSGSGATAGRGAVIQSAGTVATASGSDLVLGYGAGSTGMYTLSGGSLTAAQSEYIGLNGTGTFNHSAGTNTIAAGAVGGFDVGVFAGITGTYSLSGTGQLVSNKSEYIGDQGTGIFNQTGGSNTIQGAGNNLYLGYSAVSTSNGTYTLGNGSLSVIGDEYIGYSRSGAFNQSGGSNACSILFIGYNAGSNGAYYQTGGTSTSTETYIGGANASTFTISGSASHTTGYAAIRTRGDLAITNGGTFINSAIMSIYGLFNSVIVSGAGSSLFTPYMDNDLGIVQVTNGGTVDSGTADIGHTESASVLVTGAGSTWNTGAFWLGYQGGTGTLTIRDQGLVNVTDQFLILGGTVNLEGGTLRLNSYYRETTNNRGTVHFTAGTVQLIGDRTIGADAAISDFFGIANSATITAGKALTVEGNTIIATSLTLAGGTLTVGNLTNNGTFNFIAGTLNINQASASVNTPIVTGNPSTININATNISLGSTSSFTGFNHQGTLNVGANIVTLNSAGYARLGVLTSLAGGSIFASNGVALPSGSNLQGFGSISARVIGEKGAVIEATSSLALGDAVSPAGFNFDGELRTKQNVVTLISSAAAGLGNLTTLGLGGSPGTLNATNGFVVDFDEAITGFGTINSANTLAQHATINGTVQGNSAGQPITLSGYIKGTGSFTNVNFTGTYSPGLSPTIVTAGNLAFASTNTLIMDLGGAAAGSGYDQIQATGALALGGTLDIQLISGFTPTAGQSFNLFDWTTVSGTFSSLTLPTLAGLAWNTSQLYTSGVLSLAAAGLPGDYNQNNIVDAADYTVWRDNLGSTTSLPNDDTAGVDDGDYDRWKTHFGESNGGGALTSSTVPEPAAGVLSLMATLGLLAWPQAKPLRLNRFA